ncbi:ABC transporter substrate-binding protein [Aurantiacibacter gangjinensis]|uniref:ABC transporter substrate-binding protein n=1 Tax=Aurantiacibacter gangjinensis TaxID=502682 RepID=UPI000909BF9F|nr:ABC transporter substrate-binding protein [Aurantiacibacter gangjinensis]APE28365.1 Vitamin B12 ABC transporter, B12-binding component BtuF [Aurantiacibacter gangjinensis]
MPNRELPKQPTIVSLNPCADAILAEIAAPGQLLAISHYSHAERSASMPLEEARRFAATGGTAEEVLALSPDMVVADTFLAPATRAALEEAGIAIHSIGIAQDLEASLGQIAALGEATGNAQEAARLSSDIASAWASASYEGEPVTALLIQEGDIVPGATSLAHAMMERSGFVSLSAARGLGQGAHLPLERVLADPPDVVIAAGSGRMLDHPVLSQLDGLERFELDSTLLYCGGPTIPRALARLGEIRALIHHPPTPSSEEEGETVASGQNPLLFRGGGMGVVP